MQIAYLYMGCTSAVVIGMTIIFTVICATYLPSTTFGIKDWHWQANVMDKTRGWQASLGEVAAKTYISQPKIHPGYLTEIHSPHKKNLEWKIILKIILFKNA